MDLAYSAEDTEVRDEVRTWLAEHAPQERRPKVGLAVRELDLAWQREQYEAGWAGVAWPVDYGGRDLPLTQQLIWYEEYARTGLPPIDTQFVGLAHAGPTLMARATNDLATDERCTDAELQALSAHLAAAEAANVSTTATIQVLGGLGFTHDHDAHLYVKRTEVLAQVLGGSSTQLARLLDLPEPD